MSRRHFRAVLRVLAVIVAIALLPSARTAYAASAACDQACLTSTVDRYIDALTNRDASRLLVAKDIKFTENLVPLKFGHEGLWTTANGRRDFNIYAADPVRGDVTWIGILKENDKPVMTAIRLKVDKGRITEAETLVGRVGLGNPDTVAGPRPEFAQVVPPARRSSREQLIAIGSSNWDAMEQGNGDLAPYAADCERYDNGRKTTESPSPGHGNVNSNAAQEDIGGLSCFGQMNSGRFNNGNKVHPRRPWTVDVEHGIVVGLYTPNVPGTARVLTLRGGKKLTAGPDELIPFTIEQVEMFKVVDGQITRVEVVLGPRVPYGTRSPFDMKSLWEPR